MTYIPDPIELGESRAERHADRFYGVTQFRCAGCDGWFDWEQATPASPDPCSPAICWKCAGFEDQLGDQHGTR